MQVVRENLCYAVLREQTLLNLRPRYRHPL
jgi:hypothetical protein